MVDIKAKSSKIHGSTLKLKRLAKGISQEELCERIHMNSKVKMNQSHLSDIESGKSIPLLETFSLIINALNVDWNDVKNVYINAQKDLNVLLLVLQKCYQNQDHLTAKKTLNRLFQLLNKKAGKSRRKVLVKCLFLILFYESVGSLGTSRMIETIVTCFQEGTRRERMQLLEELYQFSNEKKQFSTFNQLIESIVGETDTERDGSFKLHNQYATGKDFEHLKQLAGLNRKVE